MNRRKSGQVLVIAVTAVLVTFVLALALLELAGASYQAGRRQQQLFMQVDSAEAGVQDARDRLARGDLAPDDGNPNWSSTFTSTGFNASTTVTLLKDSSNSVIPGRYVATTTGTQGGGTSAVRSVLRKQSLLGPFNYAMTASGTVSIGAANLDAYDSRTALVLPVLPGTGSLDAQVATNSTAANSIVITSTGAVYGSLIVGTTASPPSAAVSNTSLLTPTIPTSALPAAITYSPLVIPTGLSNQGTLKGTKVLAAGTYYYPSINLNGGDLVTCTGPVVIYCDNTVNIKGNGFVTAANLPPNLLICYTGSSGVTLSPKFPFFGAMWAPNASVTIDDTNPANVTMYGAISAQSVTCLHTSVVFFYDKALLQPGADWADHTVFNLISWEMK